MRKLILLLLIASGFAQTTVSPNTTVLTNTTLLQAAAGGGGGGAIAEVGSGSQRATQSFSGNSATLAYPANVASGSLVVVGGSCWTVGSATASIGVTDTRSTSYTVKSGTVGQLRVFIAYGITASGGANTVTVDPAGASSDCGFSIDEFSGVNATPLDVDDGMTNIGNSAAAPSTSITTVAANALIIGVMSYDDTATTGTPGASYTQIGESETGVSSQPFNAEFRIVTTGTAYTVDWTQGAATSNTGIYLVSFKP